MSAEGETQPEKSKQDEVKVEKLIEPCSPEQKTADEERKTDFALEVNSSTDGIKLHVTNDDDCESDDSVKLRPRQAASDEDEANQDEDGKSASSEYYSDNEQDTKAEKFHSPKNETNPEDGRHPSHTPKDARYYLHDSRVDDESEENHDGKSTGRRARPGIDSDRWDHDKFRDNDRPRSSRGRGINSRGSGRPRRASNRFSYGEGIPPESRDQQHFTGSAQRRRKPAVKREVNGQGQGPVEPQRGPETPEKPRQPIPFKSFFARGPDGRLYEVVPKGGPIDTDEELEAKRVPAKARLGNRSTGQPNPPRYNNMRGRGRGFRGPRRGAPPTEQLS